MSNTGTRQIDGRTSAGLVESLPSRSPSAANQSRVSRKRPERGICHRSSSSLEEPPSRQACCPSQSPGATPPNNLTSPISGPGWDQIRGAAETLWTCQGHPRRACPDPPSCCRSNHRSAPTRPRRSPKPGLIPPPPARHTGRSMAPTQQIGLRRCCRTGRTLTERTSAGRQNPADQQAGQPGPTKHPEDGQTRGSPVSPKTIDWSHVLSRTRIAERHGKLRRPDHARAAQTRPDAHAGEP